MILQTADWIWAYFLIQGPEIALRTARLFRGSDETLNIYDCNHFELQIGPFDYKPWPGAERYILLPGKSHFNKLDIDNIDNIYFHAFLWKNLYVCNGNFLNVKWLKWGLIRRFDKTVSFNVAICGKRRFRIHYKRSIKNDLGSSATTRDKIWEKSAAEISPKRRWLLGAERKQSYRGYI